MALTGSRSISLGMPAPDFRLHDVTSAQPVALDDFVRHKALLVMFICNHCPFVKHVNNELARLAHDHADTGLAIVAICSNDPAVQPGDHPDRLKEQAATHGFEFPYLVDATQEVARAYGAACTPDFFLFDEARALVYHGQLDDSRPGNNVPVSGRDLRAAIDAVLAGQAPAAEQKPSIGCSIKWSRGNQPR
jgi:peroxiredoxin